MRDGEISRSRINIEKNAVIAKRAQQEMDFLTGQLEGAISIGQEARRGVHDAAMSRLREKADKWGLSQFGAMLYLEYQVPEAPSQADALPWTASST